MTAPQKLVLVIEAAVLLFLVALPPYFGVDRDSGGRVHAQLGYFPVWSPPSALDVCRAIREPSPSGEGCEDRPQAFQARINTVRFGMNALSSLVVAAALLRALRKKTPA